MLEIVTVGLDLAKRLFQVHGADETGHVIVRKKLSRDQVLPFSANFHHVRSPWKPAELRILRNGRLLS